MLSNRTRFGVVIAALLAAAALIAIWLIAQKAGGEPRYQGQPLSFWVQQCVPSTTNQPYSMTLSDEAATAVRQMGTNALPVLLRWMRYPEHDLRLKLIESLQGRQGPRNRMDFATVRLLTPKSYQPGSAVLAFQALGPSARGAMPALS